MLIPVVTGTGLSCLCLPNGNINFTLFASSTRHGFASLAVTEAEGNSWYGMSSTWKVRDYGSPGRRVLSVLSYGGSRYH